MKFYTHIKDASAFMHKKFQTNQRSPTEVKKRGANHIPDEPNLGLGLGFRVRVRV